VPGTDILVTGAWFRIEQTNLISSIPNTPFATQSGKVRSQGVEVEASGSLPLDLNFKLAFSRQKVRTIEDRNPINVGRGILGVGKGGVSANLEWAPTKGPLDGFAIGGAVRHVFPVYAGGYGGDFNYSDPETFRGNTPSYTLFDALVRYDLGKAVPSLNGVSLAINAANVFDKKHLSTCYLDYKWCWYGNRRTVQGTIGFRF
jgi:iron complex outermembrane receptor protein